MRNDIPYHGAKNFKNTVLPSVAEAKVSDVSSMAEEEATRARKNASCLIIVGIYLIILSWKVRGNDVGSGVRFEK